jgi:hypothetical protein
MIGAWLGLLTAALLSVARSSDEMTASHALCALLRCLRVRDHLSPTDKRLIAEIEEQLGG